MRVENGQLSFSPSDLTAFLACPHLTTLQVAVARGEIQKPFRVNRHADLIRRKGDEHEAAQLALLEGVVEIPDPKEVGWPEAARLTERAMAERAPYVYQAAFVDGRWRGLADFLELGANGF